VTEPKAVGEFVRRFAADRDELVAARWWHEAMSEEAVGSGAPGQRGVRFPPLTEDTRRSILLILGGTAAGAFVLWGVSKGVDYGGDDDDVVTLDALEAQRRSGWDVGAAGTRLPYDGVSDVDAAGHADWLAALESFPSALAPTQARLLPYYVPTLFQVVTAPDFRRGFGPIHTSSMDRAQAEGRALADLFQGQREIGDTALLIDANGADAVAAVVPVAERFEPVFLFDNWPHPRGVVASHEVIAAAVYYRPLLEQARARRPADAPPVFVIDSRRLKPYRDESDAFDNRYLAKLPGAAALQGLGIRHLLYVSDVPLAHEPDDLNDDFVALGAAGIDVKMVALSDFRPVSPGGSVYYGGAPATHLWFWHSYGWYAPPTPSRGAPRLPPPAPPPPAAGLSAGASYKPVVRPTMFSSRVVGGLPGIGKQKPSGFGRVSVRTSRANGVVSIASAKSVGRSGSLGRSRSSWYGG
jgi:hypothetical protein